MHAVDAVERVHRALELTYAEIAQAITANEATLYRWRTGQSTPTAVFRRRVAALSDLVEALERAHPQLAQARAWLDDPHPVLGGRPPRSVLRDGRPDLLTGILLACESIEGGREPASRR